MTFQTEAVMAQEPETADLVPSEASASSIVEPVSASSFPKVLRRRLDSFFAEQTISPKADRTMWVKIAVGLAVLAGTWIALYAFRPGSWKFVALYLLGGLAQTFLLLNIAHDSNHNAISSRPRRQQDPELCLRSVRNQLVHVAYPPSSGPPLLHQSPWRR